MIARFFLVPAIPDLFLTYGDHTPTQDEITDRIYDGWRVSLYAYGDIDSAQFELDDPLVDGKYARTRSELLTKELYVELWDWYQGQYLRRARQLFGGQITEIKTRRKGLGRVFKCRALGWAYKLSNLIISQGYAAIPGLDGAISDRDIILGRPESGTKEGVPSLFDSAASIQRYEGVNFPVYLSEDYVKEGIENIGQREYSFQNLRSVMDRLASESGFIWRVTADRILIYRERSDKDGLGKVGLSDDLTKAVRPTGGPTSTPDAPLEFTLTLASDYSGLPETRPPVGAAYGDTSVAGSFPKELSWGDTKMRVESIWCSNGGQTWWLRANFTKPVFSPTNGQFRTDAADYRGIIVNFNNDKKASYDMSMLIDEDDGVTHGNTGLETLRLDLPSGIPGFDPMAAWSISFQQAAAPFELPEEGHRIDTSKVKNHVRVFGNNKFNKSTQTILATPNSLGARVFPIPAYGVIPGEPDGIRVEHAVDGTALKVVSAAAIPDDLTTYDVIWDNDNDRLFFNTAGPEVSKLDLTTSHQFRVTGWYGIPVTADEPNPASIQAYGVRSLIIVAPELLSTAAAERRARQELKEWDDGLEVLQGLTTDYEDFEVSTLVWVHSVVRDLNSTDANFVVEAMEVTGLSPRERTYKMKLRRDNFAVNTGGGP